MRKPKIFFVLLALVPVALGIHMVYQQWVGNFHEVLPQELYRSAQPKPENIAFLAREYAIKTILNLRNDISEEELAEQQSAAKLAGISYIHYPVSSGKILQAEQIERLVEVMRAAPKPLLIHCEHGSNRTGLATAVYVGEIAGKTEMFSEFQLSPFYGHIPIPGIGRYAMYQSWDDYEEKLGF
ncbi:fused DSP-PTPase phosphatase/NAD kinase-like protein [Bartonella sp. LJL80]